MTPLYRHHPRVIAGAVVLQVPQIMVKRSCRFTQNNSCLNHRMIAQAGGKVTRESTTQQMISAFVVSPSLECISPLWSASVMCSANILSYSLRSVGQVDGFWGH